MLRKKNRADTKTVENIFKKGVFINTPNLTFRFIKSSSGTPPKISFVAPKSLVKTAVKRNSLRRRGYSALRKKINAFPLGLVGVLMFRKSEVGLPEVKSDIKTILSKI